MGVLVDFYLFAILCRTPKPTPTRPQVKTKKEKKSKDKKKDNKPASSESEEEESGTESDSSKSDASTSEARNSKGGRKKLMTNFPKEDKLFAQKLLNAGDIVGLEISAGFRSGKELRKRVGTGKPVLQHSVADYEKVRCHSIFHIFLIHLLVSVFIHLGSIVLVHGNNGLQIRGKRKL